jgi:GcrA cell cycle regulator
MAWTDEMVEELKRLWDEGVTTGEIGRRLNISKNSIVGKVHRLGLSGRPSPIKKKSEEPSTDKAPKKTPAKEKKVVTKKVDEPKNSNNHTPVKKTTVEKKEAEPKHIEAPKVSVVPEKPSVAEPSNEDDIKLAKSMNLTAPSISKGENLSLTDLDNHTCRWPIGDPKDDDFHFCGKKIRLGQTYCEEHAAIAYVKPNKK